MASLLRPIPGRVPRGTAIVAGHGVASDGEQPRPERPAGHAVPIERAPGLQEHLLSEVFRILVLSPDPVVGMTIDPIVVAGVQPAESPRIARDCQLNQDVLGHVGVVCAGGDIDGRGGPPSRRHDGGGRRVERGLVQVLQIGGHCLGCCEALARALLGGAVPWADHRGPLLLLFLFS